MELEDAIDDDDDDVLGFLSFEFGEKEFHFVETV